MKNRRFFGGLWAWIPRHVRNGTVLRFYEMLRRLQGLLRRSYPKNRALCDAAYARHCDAMSAAGGFVEDQALWGDMPYGRSTMRAAGCEVFAVYNALKALDCPVQIPKLIQSFEADGMVLSGHFGTSPKAVADYFREKGFGVQLSCQTADFAEIARKSEAMILTMYNNTRDIRDEVHSVSITRGPDGLLAHNVCGNGRVQGPFADMSQLLMHIKNGNAGAIALIGINRP